MKIMIVDDVGYSRRSLEIQIESLGHLTVQAENGEQALQHLLKDHAIDVVITDLIMQGIDGVDLFLKAEKLERYDDSGQVSRPPFILLTSVSPERHGTNRKDAQRVTVAEEVGFEAVFFKPIDFELLSALLAKFSTNQISHEVGVPQKIDQIAAAINAIIQDGDKDSATSLLECLEERANVLHQLIDT